MLELVLVSLMMNLHYFICYYKRPNSRPLSPIHYL